MTSIFPLFDRSQIRLKPLHERRHNLTVSVVSDPVPSHIVSDTMRTVAGLVHTATTIHASTILMIGGHVIRSGVQKYIIDLIKSGCLSCIATNGAGMIHDFELALVGATTESVADYIRHGQFGLWEETGLINEIVSVAAQDGTGMGEAVGKAILKGDFPYKDISILASAYQAGIPVTVHSGIGYDIVFEHPNCNGSAYGATSYTDFLIFTKVVENLSNGIVMNFGSAVMAPEIFLKALSMARNAAFQNKRTVSGFSSLVCDLISLPEGEYHKEAEKDNPLYYFRPWKTLLVRTVDDGGRGFYIKGDHARTIPQLWTALTQ